MNTEKSMEQRILDGEWVYPEWPNAYDSEKHGTSFSVALERFYDTCRSIDQSFKKACLEDLDIRDHPKADLLFQTAFEIGEANNNYGCDNKIARREVYRLMVTLSKLLV